MKKEKIYNLLLFILIFFAILSVIIIKPVNDLDEIWNYNFAKNIADGLIPYKDFNIIVTPLLSIICGFILKITFNELIVIRILAALLCSAIIYITYKLFCILNIKKEVAIIFTFFIGYLFKNIFCIDYNYASLLLVLIIIYKEIKNYQKYDKVIDVNLKEDIILGILAGLSIVTKQTSGLLICLAVLGNKLIFVRNKNDLKIFIKSLFYRLIGIIIPVLVFILYLVINNAFEDFVSYAIKGVADFSNTISYKSLIGWNLIGILSILVPITFVYVWIKSIILEKDRKMYLFTVYGLAIFIVCFPISNEIHFLIGSLPIIIFMLYELNNFINCLILRRLENKMVEKFILSTLECMIILFLIYYTIINLYNYLNQKENYSTLNHFRYISINASLEEEIKKVDEYILENKNVKILDSSAATYMIPLDKYNKDYDMFNKGNFGFKGEERIIEEISNSENIKYLVLTDKYYKTWQTPLNIIQYVKDNKTKTGMIEVFDVYE